jgi:hypothetical protein
MTKTKQKKRKMIIEKKNFSFTIFSPLAGGFRKKNNIGA